MGERLLDLREKLTEEVPPRNLQDSLLLATWNIREFDFSKGGRCSEESFAYIAEIISSFELIADFLARRADEPGSWSNNIILIGDFNIFHNASETMQAITDAGFLVPPELQSLPASNLGKKKRRYDQIAFKVRANHLKPTGRAGVFDFYKSVYRPEDEAIYADTMGPRYQTTAKGVLKGPKEQSRYYLSDWRTHQMSDHLPMWVKLKIDFGGEYLAELVDQG